MKKYRIPLMALVVLMSVSTASAIQIENVFPTCTTKGLLILKKMDVRIDYLARLSDPYVSIFFEYPPGHVWPDCTMVFANDQHGFTADTADVTVNVDREKSEKGVMYVEYIETYVTGGGWLYRSANRVVVYVPDSKTKQAYERTLQVARDWKDAKSRGIALPEIHSIPLNR